MHASAGSRKARVEPASKLQSASGSELPGSENGSNVAAMGAANRGNWR